MVVFATPGMLHAGLSLQIFKRWADDEKNMVRSAADALIEVNLFPLSLPSSLLPQLIMPGYCVAGTIGHKVLSGAKKIEIEKKMVNVKLSVQYMSFRCNAKRVACKPA